MAFALLPLEVNAHIATCLDSDSDLCNFSLICRETHDAVTCAGSPVWREFFLKHFDLIPHIGNDALRCAYQFRREVLRNGADFSKSNAMRVSTKQERECLQVLKDLILESFSGGSVEHDENGLVTSRNIQSIKKFAYSSNILHDVRIRSQLPANRTRSRNLLMMIQIILAPWQFDLTINTNVLGFQDSQIAMYESIREMPIFTGANKDEVNLIFVAQAINFFKYHFTQRWAQTLWHYYEALSAEEKPKAWRKPLNGEAPLLSKKWGGTYTYLGHEEVARLRSGTDEVFEDVFNNTEDGKSPFQSLHLAFSEANSKIVWPPIFERHLQSISGPYTKSATSREQSHPGPRNRTRAQRRAVSTAKLSSLRTEKLTEKEASRASRPFHFYGSGVDADKFYATGWLNPLPPQQDFPGMQRITMMKYFLNEDTADDDETALARLDIDLGALWAYEGVVLPGGEIMVGRWWSPDLSEHSARDEAYSGPFILFTET